MSHDIPLVTKSRARLVPSIPAGSFHEIEKILNALKGVITGIQIDIVDGKFAPNVTWPFTEIEGIESLKLLTPYNELEIEFDCMCMNPEIYLDTFVSIGVARVVIHAESTTQYELCITHAHTNKYRIGLGIRNTTESGFLSTYIPQFDFVQVMGIENIGLQGQPFDGRTFDTIKNLRSQYPHLEIAVDGGVNETTLPLLVAAGANRFAPGSALSKVENPPHAYTRLLELL